MKLDKPQSLEKIAGMLNAEYSGEPDHLIHGINEIHGVEKGDLTFVDNDKYFSKVLNSRATTIIINKRVDCPENKALIFSDDPFMDYNKLVKNFNRYTINNNNISPEAKIGKGTIIQPGAIVGGKSEIGDNCIINSNVTIYDNVKIGNNVVIQSGTTIGGDAFYFQKRKDGYHKLRSCGRVIIQDNVEIGANCTIDRGVSSDTVIGKGTKMDNLIQIGHDTKIGKNCLFASQVGISGCVIVEDDVILWGQVGVQKDLTIGAGAVVLGQSGIPKSLEGDKTYFGSPVQNALDKMKELSYIKRLPDILKLLEK